MTAAAVSAPTDWRRDFPLLAGRAHLSGCSLPPRWRGIEDAMAGMLATMAEAPAPWHVFEEAVETARQRFAELVHARPEQIAVLPAATVAGYQVLSVQDWTARSGLVGTEADFPSISQVFGAQEARGVERGFVADPLSVESWRAAVTERTGLVSVPLATYLHGSRPPVAEVCRLADEVGARSFVDAYQGAGVLPIDVEELGCDYLVAGSNKYLLGLPGVVFLYSRDPGADARTPQLTGWMGRDGAAMFDPYATEPAGTARRYEIGTPPIPSVLSVSAGLALINEIGVPAIAEHVGRLRDRLAAGAEGLRLVGHRPGEAHGAHLAFEIADPERIAAELAGEGIFVSPRGPVVRVALHLYNTEQDVDRVLVALRERS
ncbi:MAG TPA: aminotransferase class V-fold PLP-dependent enzyme [Jatrophihabitans sp.]|nr:aminotransferase class V-fold PLP-dependent enzyme [Jatrophihabitans sp.]